MVFNWLEWSGAATGLYGAFLLARDGKDARNGWYWFLAANGFIVAFAIQQGHVGLLVQQVGFTCTSLYGVVVKWRKRALAPLPASSSARQSDDEYYASIPCEDYCPLSTEPGICRTCDQVANGSNAR